MTTTPAPAPAHDHDGRGRCYFFIYRGPKQSRLAFLAVATTHIMKIPIIIFIILIIAIICTYRVYEKNFGCKKTLVADAAPLGSSTSSHAGPARIPELDRSLGDNSEFCLLKEQGMSESGKP